MQSDEQLATAAQRGSDAAFSELVDRYRNRLLRFLLTRSASHADAEDSTQDAFVNAYRYLQTYDPRWRFSTWLYRIALQNLKSPPRHASLDDHDAIDHDDPLAQCIRIGQRENLWLTARRLLGADAYTAMWLHYVEDMPQKEVADVLDRSLAWTKVSLLRSRRSMSAEMNRQSAADRSIRYG